MSPGQGVRPPDPLWHFRLALVRYKRLQFSVSFGALVAFGVRVLRDVVDVSCHGGLVEAFRGVSEASGGHFGAPKSSTKQETAQQAVSGQCSATQSTHEQRRAKHGRARQHSKAPQVNVQHSTA